MAATAISAKIKNGAKFLKVRVLIQVGHLNIKKYSMYYSFGKLEIFNEIIN